jgi:hypothetical protein
LSENFFKVFQVWHIDEEVFIDVQAARLYIKQQQQQSRDPGT